MNPHPIAHVPPGTAKWSMDSRESARLMFAEGRSCNEIARTMQVPLGTVKSRKRRAGRFEPKWVREDLNEMRLLRQLESSPL
jgi:hypothetical protein